MAAGNGTVPFVGAKRAAREVIRREAARCGMPCVDQRWLGGMLTNFKTVRASIARLREMEAMEEDGRVQRMSKKEALGFRRVLAKLQRSLLARMSTCPGRRFADGGVPNPFRAASAARTREAGCAFSVSTPSRRRPVECPDQVSVTAAARRRDGFAAQSERLARAA